MQLRRLIASALATLLAAGGLVGTGVVATAAPAAADEPDPVVIVAGTSAAQPIADVFYAVMANRLESDGYEAFIFGLPGGGLGDIAATSQTLSDFVDDVLIQTGADQVDLVGHSQGGLVGRYYVRFLDGDPNVDNLISLGAPHYGTSLANLVNFLGLGSCLGVIACQQMAIGSDFLAGLNADDDSFGDVQYTNIITTLDVVVTPYTNGRLQPDDNNTNITVQSLRQCPLRVVGHLTLATDGAVYSGIRQALEDRDRIRLNCLAW